MICVQVINKPSFGRYTKLEEPKARESLLTPSMRKSASKTSLKSSDTGTTATGTTASSSTGLTIPTTTATTGTTSGSKSLPPVPPSPMDSEGDRQAGHLLQAVAKAGATVLERTPFAIDDAQDSEEEEEEEDDEEEDDDDDDEEDDEEDDEDDDEEDEEEDDEEEVNEDDQVLDEVDAFLEAHESGLTEADREVAKRTSFLSFSF